jgi:adenylate kinase family enzyme
MSVAPVGPSRILVYGVTGSGKSTVAERISERLGVPWYPVDDLGWEPGWVPVPNEVIRERIVAICDQPEWILDSAYSSWLDVPLGAADLVVGLDFPRWFSLRRLITRTAIRVMRQTPVCNGNRESMRSVWSKDSILVWHFRSFKRKQRRMRRWQAEMGGTKILLFRTPSALNSWLRGLRRMDAN